MPLTHIALHGVSVQFTDNTMWRIFEGRSWRREDDDLFIFAEDNGPIVAHVRWSAIKSVRPMREYRGDE